jgi:hypothetical protein
MFLYPASFLNEEAFYVSGITDGKYRLSIDGADVGIYPKRTFEKRGLSVGFCEKAPQVIQAKEIVQLGTDRYAQERTIRIMARMKKRVGSKVNLDDEAAFNAWAEGFLAKLKPEDAAKFQTDLKQYREARTHEKEALQKIDELTAKIYETNKPKTHAWTLEKVSGKGE